MAGSDQRSMIDFYGYDAVHAVINVFNSSAKYLRQISGAATTPGFRKEPDDEDVQERPYRQEIEDLSHLELGAALRRARRRRIHGPGSLRARRNQENRRRSSKPQPQPKSDNSATCLSPWSNRRLQDTTTNRSQPCSLPRI
jgi:hypothetical protein